jgi:hypothetical protein
MRLTYLDRRRLLEQLDLRQPRSCRTRFDDGAPRSSTSAGSVALEGLNAQALTLSGRRSIYRRVLGGRDAA